MEWLQDFHFLRPWWLLALIVPFVWGWFIYKNERVQSSWAEVCDEHLLNYLLIKGDNQQRRLSFVLALLVMVCGIIAIAGPTWLKKQNPALSVDNPVMIVLNLSSDMEAKDTAPNRLTRARYIIKDFIRSLHSSEIGMEVYSDEPFIISPLTEDAALIDNLLPAIDRKIMPANGDRLDRAINMAVQRMRGVGYGSGNIIVVAADVGERFDGALTSAEKAHQQGFDVSVIKVSAVSNEKLQMIAQKGGGVYLNYKQNYDVLSNKINDLYTKKLNESKNMQSTWVDLGYYLFWFPAFLLLYYYRRGVIAGLLLCLLCSEAYAGWFLNDNQEAVRYFKQKQYAKAAQMFQDTKWRGAAAYKNGDYAAAYREFAKSDDVTSLYNQGNALAKSGKIDEAIAKYEEVLKQDPKFADAEFNLEYLKKLKQNQNQKQNQKQDNQQDKQQQQQAGGNDQQQNNQQQNEQQQGNQDQSEEQQKKEQQEQNQEKQQQEQSAQNNTEQNKSEQNQEDAAKEPKEGNQQSDNQQQNEQQQTSDSPQNDGQSDGKQQSGGEQEHSAEQENSADSRDTSATGNDNKQSDEDKSSEKEQEAEIQVQSGQPDENGQEAETVNVQNGDKDNDDKNKIRARVQKFREVPEDKGGLLRALIAKEYEKNRYKDE